MKQIYILLFSIFLTSNSVTAQEELVYWVGGNTSTLSYPENGQGLSSALNAGLQNYNGLNTIDNPNTGWRNLNSSTSVDPATSPYLSYTLTTNDFIQFDRFVVHGIANGSALQKMQLRWSIDNYTTSLGEFTPGGVSLELTSVDISTTPIIPSGSVEFRIYFYSQSGSVFNSINGPYPSTDETPSSYTSNGRNFSIWGTPLNFSPSANNELVYWVGGNTSTLSYPENGQGLSSALNAGVQNYNGLNTYDHPITCWNNPNSSTSVDPATSPYLSYTLTTNDFIQFDRFVVHGIANGSALQKMQLRWNIDNYTTSLGEFNPGGVSLELTSVDISTTPIIPSGSVEFRIYFYSQSGFVFNSINGPYPSTDETPSSYTSNGRNFSIWGNLFNSSTLSTETSFLLESDVKLFPNPANKYIKISKLTKTENYEIYDVMGKKISDGIISNNEKIHIKNLTNGLYFLRFKNGNTIKFIKN